MSEEVLPRDVKIVHLILASMGITSYQDHVPLQLLDFAHRYTTQVCQDALVYSDYANQTGATQPAGMGPQSEPLSIDDIKLAVSARVAYQFKPTTPKDLLMTLAAERNKRALPPVSSSYGLRLPPEKHCLTGRDRDIDEDDNVIVAGYEKINFTDASQESNENKSPVSEENKEDTSINTKSEGDEEVMDVEKEEQERKEEGEEEDRSNNPNTAKTEASNELAPKVEEEDNNMDTS